MCQWGQTVDCLVPMPDSLSHTGKFRWAIKGIDSCIADLVNALNAGGVYTANSCCGHGSGEGIIFLHDGRVIRVTRPTLPDAELMADEALNDYHAGLTEELDLDNDFDLPALSDADKE